MKLSKLAALTFVLSLLIYCLPSKGTTSAQVGSRTIGEGPALEEHTNQSGIESGAIKFKKLLEIGEQIFAARWNKFDGQGRPAATGAGTPTKRDPSHDPGLIRTSGTDSTSCADSRSRH